MSADADVDKAELARLRAAEAQQAARAEAARLDALLAGTPEGLALVLSQRRMDAEVRRLHLLLEGITAANPSLAGIGPGGAWMLESLVGSLPKDSGVSVFGLARVAYHVHGRLEFTAAGQIALARCAGIDVDFEWVAGPVVSGTAPNLSIAGRIRAKARIDGKDYIEEIDAGAQQARSTSTEWKRDPIGMAEYAVARRLFRRKSKMVLGILGGDQDEDSLVAVSVAPAAPAVAAVPAPRQISAPVDLPDPLLDAEPAREVVEATEPTRQRPPARRRAGGDL